MKRILLFLLFVFALGIAVAQQQPMPQPPNGPLELPEFLVMGKELINVGAGAKQSPQRPPLLSATRLDSLNPTEKQPIPVLPARPLPQYQRSAQMWPGYLQAEMGNYITPQLYAGYSLVAGRYRIDFSGDVHASDGWVNNASYLTAGVRAISTYRAPDKFVFFGGSTTQADVGMRYRSYTLFARSDTVERKHSTVNAGIDVEGKFDDVTYRAQASWTGQMLSTTSMRDVTDNVVHGGLRVEQQWKSADVGALVDMRLQSYASNAYPFVETGAYARWVSSSLRISGGAGVQWATSTSGVDRFGLALGGQADFFLGPDYTFTATARSGMRPIAFRDLMLANQYVDDSVGLDAAYDIIDLRGTITYHPSVRTSVSVGVRICQTDREAVWKGSRQGLFSIDYRTVSLVELHADARFVVTPRDVVVADVRMTSASVAEEAAQPYIPAVLSSVHYDRTWSETFQTGIGMIYVGQRWTDFANSKTLAGYIDLRLKASCSLSKSFDLHARAENLLGSTVFLWEGYRERGIFITAGCTWKF